MRSISDKIIEAIRFLPRKERTLVSIDGRCASGKTTLSNVLEKKLGAAVFHMDDFFLRPSQRTAERLAAPGGNVDYERFYEEILAPLKRREEVIRYRPYDCTAQALMAERLVKPSAVVIIEGAYACHPYLRDVYDLTIFLSVSPKEQLRRIILRNGQEKAIRFRDRWIPMEERYFTEYRVEKYCDLFFDNSIPNIEESERRKYDVK